MEITYAKDLSLEALKGAPMEADGAIEAAAARIVLDVRARGDAALLELTERFDGARLDSLAVTSDEIEAAWAAEDGAFKALLAGAADNIRAFHRRQLREGFVVSERPGIVLGQRLMPLGRVGLYVPGGTASYPSSVLMNAIPAALAGVQSIAVVTPPGPDGRIAPSILCAARMAGVTEIYKVGGAQAVAALAYGTETVARVDKIVGPGNAYVAAAKRRVYGVVDIDMVAGPSEILVIADGRSSAREVAADLLSQAEHDALSKAILLTDSEALARAVQIEVEAQLSALPRERIARASIEANGQIIVVDSMKEAVDISNAIAPEHLELCVDEPFALLGAVTNAGSVFLGRNAPEALGDYWAGLNHTLPTSGTARFSSPLSVDDFLKKTQFVYYTREALAEARLSVMAFAEREGLGAHARSIGVRFEGDAL